MSSVAEETARALPPAIEHLENKESRIPASVHYEVIAKNRHVVMVDGIAGKSIHEEGKLEEESFHQTPLDYMPESFGFISIEMNYKTRNCKIITSKKIKPVDLSLAINELAKIRSDVPCWAELYARDLERAEDFRDDRYRSEKLNGEFPAGLAWFWLSRSMSFSAPFIIGSNAHRGQLFVVPNPVPQGSPYRYTVRLLGQAGRVVWMDSSTANGVVRIAVGDADGNGEHEIYLGCNENGVESRFCIKMKTERDTPTK